MEKIADGTASDEEAGSFAPIPAWWGIVQVAKWLGGVAPSAVLAMDDWDRAAIQAAMHAEREMNDHRDELAARRRKKG